MSNFIKIRPVEADRQTDMTKLTATFRNFCERAKIFKVNLQILNVIHFCDTSQFSLKLYILGRICSLILAFYSEVAVNDKNVQLESQQIQSKQHLYCIFIFTACFAIRCYHLVEHKDYGSS